MNPDKILTYETAGKLFNKFFVTPPKRVQERSTSLRLIPEDEVEARVKESQQKYYLTQGENRGNFGGKKVATKKVDYWIPKSVNEHKAGSLHRMLGVPESEDIPFTLLEKIRITPIGETIKNPTKTGKTNVKITKLVKQRSVWALNMKRISQKRKK